MDYQFYNFNSETESEEEEEYNPRKFRILRGYSEPWDFHQRFRFTPRQFEMLLQILGQALKPKSVANHAISPKHKLLATLRFYASNDYYYTLQDSMGKLIKTTVY